MDGVTILATIPAKEMPTIAWIVVAAFAVFGYGSLIKCYINDECDETFMFFGSAFIAIGMLFIGLFIATGHGEQKIATVDKNVPYFEFVEKYEIQDHYDDIFILKEVK